MLKTTKLEEDEMRQFAEAFAYYDYGDEEIGMVPFYPGYPNRTRLINYLLAMIRVANDCNAVYSTGKENEGILILTDTTHPYPTAMTLKMMWKMVKALGFMRSLVETAFEVADRNHLPVILSTDAKLKKERYEHLGMSLVNVRQMDERSFMYDLAREAQ